MGFLLPVGLCLEEGAIFNPLLIAHVISDGLANQYPICRFLKDQPLSLTFFVAAVSRHE